MFFDNIFNYCQTQTTAPFSFSGTGPVYLVESLPDVFYLVFRDTRALITDRKFDPFIISIVCCYFMYTDFYFTVNWREVNRIIQQIYKDLVDTVMVYFKFRE